MRLSSLVPALVFLVSAHAQVQQARRIAIYSFQDIYTSQGAQIGQKLYDRLLSKLTDSGAYQIIDRQFLEKVIKEQQLPIGRFDASTAVTIGKLVNVAAIVDGTITTATVNQRSSEDATGYYGTVTVAATARLISTETGALLKAPTASESARGMIQIKPQQRTCKATPFRGVVCTTPPAPSADTKTMDQLLDEAIEACARSLATNLAAASLLVATSSSAEMPSIPRMATPATVIGAADGITYLNKGASAGLKVGQVLQVYRVVSSGLNDPDTGKPLIRKSPVCTLTLSDVEERSSSGKCAGSSPTSGDAAEVRIQ